MDGLYETLCIIGREERFAASGMQEERTETGIRFTAEYEYHVMLTEETTERMERLKYNGKEAVGYEEKGNSREQLSKSKTFGYGKDLVLAVLEDRDYTKDEAEKEIQAYLTGEREGI